MKKVILSIILCFPITLISSNIIKLRFGDAQQALGLIKDNDWLPDNPTIVDAGAYVGDESILMASKFWPTAHVYSFEPVPDIYERLIQNTKDYKNITPVPYALSHQNGEANFYVSEEKNKPGVSSMSSSLLEPKEHLHYSATLFPKKITVPTITLDDWTAQHGIEKIDFLWFDLQGSELPVLKGSPNIMKTVKVIFTEVEFVEAYKGQSLYSELKSWLESQGFTLIAKNFTEPLAKTEWSGIYWFGDCLFVRD